MGGVAHNETHFLFVCVLDFDRGRGWRGDEAVDRGRGRCWLAERADLVSFVLLVNMILSPLSPLSSLTDPSDLVSAGRAARGAGQHNTNVVGFPSPPSTPDLNINDNLYVLVMPYFSLYKSRFG